MENKERYSFIDVFKFWALCSLMFYHSFEAWVTGGSNIYHQDSYIEIYQLISKIGTIICYIPCLGMPFLSGFTLYVMSRKYIKNDLIEISEKSLKFIVKRFFLIFFAATLFSFVNYGFGNFYETDVLHCIAFSTLIIFLMHSLANKYLLIVFSIIWVFLSKEIHSYFSSHEVEGVLNYFKIILIGSPYENESFYSLTPWLAMDMIGFAVASFFFKYKEQFFKYSYLGWFLIIPSYLISPDPWVIDVNSYWSDKVFKPTPIAFVCMLMSILSFLLILINVFKKIEINNFIFKSFVKNIMWVYIFHTAFVYLFYPWLYSVTKGDFLLFWLFQPVQIAFGLVITLTISKIRNKLITKAL